MRARVNSHVTSHVCGMKCTSVPTPYLPSHDKKAVLIAPRPRRVPLEMPEFYSVSWCKHELLRIAIRFMKSNGDERHHHG